MGVLSGRGEGSRATAMASAVTWADMGWRFLSQGDRAIRLSWGISHWSLWLTLFFLIIKVIRLV
jgi:hypothetical protein